MLEMNATDQEKLEYARSRLEELRRETIARFHYMMEAACVPVRPRPRIRTALVETTALYPVNRRPVHRLFMWCGIPHIKSAAAHV